MARTPLACRLLSHRWAFWREGRTIRWACARGCPEAGAREYATEREASGYLRHLSREPHPPAPLLAALSGTLVRRPPQRRGRDS